MLIPQTILLAYHGTPGAKLAEALAFEFAHENQTTIKHLLIVPDFWEGMQGDDWLNNASTRDDFGRYVEGLLEVDAKEQLLSVKANCLARNLAYESFVRVGDPTECLVEATQVLRPTFAVIGPRRAKGVAGYRSHINLEKSTRKLTCPLLIASQPV